MSTQKLTTQFPGNRVTSGLIQSITDVCTLTSQNPNWSPGVTAAVVAALNGPTAQQKWNLISCSIQGYLGVPILGYGKLGKIIAGIIPDYAGETINTGLYGAGGYGVPLLPLPDDLSLTADMWNPANDPLMPIKSAPESFSDLLPISTTISPPEAIPLVPGEPLAASIWMFPSLLGINGYSGVIQLSIYNASATIIYDDGE